MKKVVLIISMIIVLFINSLSFATDKEEIFDFDEKSVTTHTVADEQESEKSSIEDNEKEREDNETSKLEEEKKDEETITPATQKILNNSSKKERKLAEYEDKYNDKTYAYTAYILELIQTYSIPVCVIGIAIGAFNLYIIGEKKLDKREKGFSLIMAFLGGLVVFQILPLVFALLVAGK